MLNPERPCQRRQAGFALVLALGAMAVVLALAAALDVWTDSRLEQARLIRARLQGELDAYSTRETVLYLLGTGGFTRAGLRTSPPRDSSAAGDAGEEDAVMDIEPVGGELAVDGTPYRGIGRTLFALQDQSGLVPLNTDSQSVLRALLEGTGENVTVVDALLDALRDYRDNDQEPRPNGAEDRDYATAGLQPPANRNLRSAPELLQAWGWRDWLAEHPELRLHDWLGAGRVEAFNPNTAPAAMLPYLDGMTPDTVRALLEERAANPFRSVADFSARVGAQLQINSGQYRFFPSDSLVLRVWTEGGTQAELLGLQLTPLGRQGPWRIDGVYRINQGWSEAAHEVSGDYFHDGSPAAR